MSTMNGEDVAALLAEESEAVALSVKRKLAERKASAILRKIDGAVAPPPIDRLDAFLAVPDLEDEYRIEPIMLMDADVLVVAQKKVGKSTLVANLIRSLVDGEPFLGRLPVTPLPEGRSVVLFDNELGERTLRRWLREQGIQNDHLVHVVDLKGRLSSFDIMQIDVRAEWAQKIQAANGHVIIFDCLRPALDALGMSEDKEASRFAEALTALKIMAGAPDLFLIHHAGHDGTRARGDSALAGWCTDEWRLTLASPSDPFSARRFFAYGRSRGLPSTNLEYDFETRRLSLAPESLSTVRDGANAELVRDAVATVPGLTSSDLHVALKAVGITNRTAANAAMRAAQEGGLVVARKEGKANRFYVAEDAGVMWSSGAQEPDSGESVGTRSGGEHVPMPEGDAEVA